MNWDAIGAAGEWAGAIGVIATLVYLAGQLKQNTKALRSSTYQSYVAGSFSFADTLIESAQQLSDITQHSEFSQLSPDQQYRCNGYFLKSFTFMESHYLHHRAGSLDDDVFEARMRSSVDFIASIPLARKSWGEATSRYGIVPEFVDYLDRRLQTDAD
jgi:hypothetical protein